jgi:hypothetical protein
MAFKFNPFTGNFDLAGSKVDTYLDGEVATYDDLPLDTAAAPLNSAWLVREASGLWFLTRKPAGIYVLSAAGGTDRDADYTYAGTFPDVFSDANFVVYNDADSTKNVKFSAANVTTGTTRTLTVPDKNGTIATTDAADLATGTLADARLSSNVPLLDAANTFSANQTLDGTNNVAPNQTAASGSSLITRDLGDARYYERSASSYLTADSTNVVNNSTTYADAGVSVTLGVGTWLVESTVIVNSANSSAGARIQIVTSGTSPTIIGGFSRYGTGNGVTFTDDASLFSERTTATGIRYIRWFRVLINVGSATTTLTPQFSQGTAHASNTVAKAGTMIFATKIP